MIRDFQNGDIVTSGDPFITGKAATAKGLKYRLKMFLGEYFLDISDGTPWFQNILGKAPQDVAEIALKQRIITAQDVIGISQFSFETDAQSRQVTVRADIVDVNNEQVQLLLDEDII